MELTKLDCVEKKRVYFYRDGTTETIKNVTHFKSCVTTHRLKTTDGKLHIILEGWRRIEITADEFTI